MPKKQQKKDPKKIAEDGPFITDIGHIQKGERVQFDIDDRTYFLNFPSDALRDEYSFQRDKIELELWQREDVNSLLETPLPPKRLKEIDADIDEVSSRMDKANTTDQRNYWNARLKGLYKEKTKTSADLLVDRQLRLLVSRWMARRILADEKGDLIADTDEKWNALPPIVQDEATARAAMLMQSLHMIRFLSEVQPDSE